MNSNLQKAKKYKNDEFYTQINDIEKEIKNYKNHFKDKIIYCNCDDPEWSHFFKYFFNNFEFLGLKKVITTHFKKNGKKSYKLELSKQGKIVKIDLKGDGDFRNEECIKILKESDIVVTNPPFSLFREYIAQLIEYDKKFLIIGSMNAITYKETFKFIKDNQLWLGINSVKEFIQPNGSIKKFGNINWYTNMEHKKRNEEIILYKTYKNNEEDYQKYDNYSAINIDKIKDIPMDYNDVMGVPITFMYKYNPNQFDIVGITTGRDEFEAIPTKRYKNPKQINKDGSQTNGSKANTRATLLWSNKPNGIHYVADNASGYLSIVYARILIRNQKL